MPTVRGDPYRLGAESDRHATNFSVISGVAERVDLCLFAEDGDETRLELPAATGHSGLGYVPSIGQKSGQVPNPDTLWRHPTRCTHSA
jgi:isoamylase